jgi:hypothetical protein
MKERFFLRFHMSLILLATVLTGLLSTKLLLLVPVDNIVIRYPLVVLIAYLAFFLFVKLWLAYMSASRPLKSSNVAGDVLSNMPDLPGGIGPSIDVPAVPHFGGGGGTFDGAGAAGAFDGPVSSASADIMSSSSGAAESSSGLADAAGDAVSGIFDFDDDGLILIVLGVLLAAVFGSAIYLIYIAPHILSEAAFDFLLGTSLIRSYKKVNQPDWMGSVFHDTYKPFLAVLLITIAAAWIIHVNNPEITKLSDLLTQ